MSTQVRCHQHAEQVKAPEDIDYLDDGSRSLMHVFMFLCMWGVCTGTHTCLCMCICMLACNMGVRCRE